MAGQGAIEVACLLSVLKDEVIAGCSSVKPVCGSVIGRIGEIRHTHSFVELLGSHPSKHYFLPHIYMGRTVAMLTVPCSRSEQIPYAGAAVFSSVLLIVGVIKVWGAKVMAEFMTHDAYGAHVGRGSECLRLDCVSAHFHAIHTQAIEGG